MTPDPMPDPLDEQVALTGAIPIPVPAPPASADPAVIRFAKHVNPAFVKLLGVFGYGRLYTKARDIWIWDHQDHRYLDCLSGFSSVNIGHNHPRLLERLRRYLSEDILNFVHIGPSAQAGELAERLVALAGPPFEVALFSNSGAEAVEAGLKLARASTRRSGFVSCDGSYHGTTLGTLSVMGEGRARGPFEPLLAGCERIPFGDLGALEAILARRKTAAFVVDPFLCEWSAAPPPPGYLKAAQEICRRHGTLLVLDEVQTALGRTGALFAFQNEGFAPDVVCLAKSLSGGIAPIGATLTTAEIHERAYGTMDRFDCHASTFGGNGFSCVAALETLAILHDEKLIQASRQRGEQLREALRLRLSGHALVKSVRGRGLMISIELGPTEANWVQRLAPGLVEAVARNVFGQWAAVKLLERDVICQPATQHWNVLKLMPPLTLPAAEVPRIVDAVGGVLDSYPGLTSVLSDVGKRIGKQFMAGWAF